MIPHKYSRLKSFKDHRYETLDGRPDSIIKQLALEAVKSFHRPVGFDIIHEYCLSAFQTKFLRRLSPECNKEFVDVLSSMLKELIDSGKVAMCKHGCDTFHDPLFYRKPRMEVNTDPHLCPVSLPTNVSQLPTTGLLNKFSAAIIDSLKFDITKEPIVLSLEEIQEKTIEYLKSQELPIHSGRFGEAHYLWTERALEIIIYWTEINELFMFGNRPYVIKRLPDGKYSLKRKET